MVEVTEGVDGPKGRSESSPPLDPNPAGLELTADMVTDTGDLSSSLSRFTCTSATFELSASDFFVLKSKGSSFEEEESASLVWAFCGDLLWWASSGTDLGDESDRFGEDDFCEDAGVVGDTGALAVAAAAAAAAAAL